METRLRRATEEAVLGSDKSLQKAPQPISAPSRDIELGTAHRLPLLGRDHVILLKCLSPTGFLEESQHLEEQVVRLKDIHGVGGCELFPHLLWVGEL